MLRPGTPRMKLGFVICLFAALAGYIVWTLLSVSPSSFIVPVTFRDRGPIKIEMSNRTVTISGDTNLILPNRIGELTLVTGSKRAVYSYDLSRYSEAYWVLFQEPLRLSGGGLELKRPAN